MPRYFFDVSDKALECDHEGVDLSDLRVARHVAIRTLLDIAREAADDMEHAAFAIAVRDAAGKQVYRASMKLDGEWTDK